jgi:hypothetical protein
MTLVSAQVLPNRKNNQIKAQSDQLNSKADEDNGSTQSSIIPSRKRTKKTLEKQPQPRNHKRQKKSDPQMFLNHLPDL